MKIINVPTSQGSLGKNKGSELAPELITSEAEEVDIVENNLEETNKNIGRAEGDLFIGGDHSITYPLFKKFSEKNPNPALIIFDAHADCTNNFNPPTHEDINKTLIEEGYLKPENLMLIGLRKVDPVEKEYLADRNIKHVYFEDIKEDLVEQIKEFVKDKQLYLSIDIDILSPEEAPGTGYLEPEGMNLQQLLDVLKEIKPLAKQVDLVEVNPSKDVDGKTVKAAKKIVGIF